MMYWVEEKDFNTSKADSLQLLLFPSMDYLQLLETKKAFDKMAWQYPMNIKKERDWNSEGWKLVETIREGIGLKMDKWRWLKNN